MKATNENLPPNVIRQLAKELKNLDQSPPEGIRVIVNDDDFTSISADIEGPGKVHLRGFDIEKHYIFYVFPLMLVPLQLHLFLTFYVIFICCLCS
jgi:hypothetical protein